MSVSSPSTRKKQRDRETPRGDDHQSVSWPHAGKMQRCKDACSQQRGVDGEPPISETRGRSYHTLICKLSIHVLVKKCKLRNVKVRGVDPHGADEDHGFGPPMRMKGWFMVDHVRMAP